MYNKISIKEFDDAVKAHELWLIGKDGGKQADFDYTDLKDHKLQGVNLTKASLQNADLQGANLEKTVLINASLSNTNLSESNLLDTEFWSADLSGADLQNSKNILLKSFAGANLTRAKLPPGVLEPYLFKIIGNASAITRKIFLIMLTLCIYIYLTIGTTTDLGLLVKSESQKLPLLNISIPLHWFYIVVPFVLLGIYIYFHLNLRRLYERIALMPAIIPDGNALDKVLFPWLFNDIIRSYYPRLIKRYSFLYSNFQLPILLFLGWWFVPVTIVLLWLRYLPINDHNGTLIQLPALWVSVFLALIFSRVTVTTLDPTLQIARESYLRYYFNKITILINILIICISVTFSYAAFHGFPYELYTKYPKSEDAFSKFINAKNPHDISMIFRAMLPFNYINIEDLNASTKPENWPGCNPELVKGVVLNGKDLQFMNATRVFMVNADLERTNMRGAILKSAILVQAKLRKANLQGADLSDAQLNKCTLYNCDLTEAYLERTNLEDAKFYDYDEDTNLRSIIRRAKLQGAILKGADLRNVILTASDLKEANLDSAKLNNAILKDVDFSGANLVNAKLDFAEIDGAKFKTAKGLTKSQLAVTIGQPESYPYYFTAEDIK